MLKNNSAFTMIELLAAIIVLGILMGIGVPTVMNIMSDQKNKMYIQDAIRLASSTDYKIRKDNKITIPPRGGCLIFKLSDMNDNSYEKAPYGGSYDKDLSFVIARRNKKDEYKDDEYDYYVTLVEKTETGTYRGIKLREVNYLYSDEAKDNAVENFRSSDLIEPTNVDSIDNCTNIYSVY